MNYPLISEYVEAIKAAEDNFKKLTNLRPVLGEDGQPVMSIGNYSVVFKMEDEERGDYYAVKCFIKEQEGRSKAYKQITNEFQNVFSNYVIKFRYYEKELFVATKVSNENEFPVVLMEWIEARTLCSYLHDNCDYRYLLEKICFDFSILSYWLLHQPFAHGDLKSDNILVKNDGSIVLVDYDGMYVPAMRGQKARELGSPDYQHPQRKESDFDAHIDDFPLLLILMSLKAISIKPELVRKYSSNGTLLFSKEDFVNFGSSQIFTDLYHLLDNEEFCRLFGAFIMVYADRNMKSVSLNSLILKNSSPMIPSDDDIIDRGWKFLTKSQTLLMDDIFFCGPQKTEDQLLEQNEMRSLSNKYKEKAFQCFMKVAKQGNPKAQYALGFYFEYYNLHELASEYYLIAAEHGYPPAQEVVGHLFGSGVYSINVVSPFILSRKTTIPKSAKNSVLWYMLAAHQGYASAQYSLASCYLEGEGVSQCYEKAIDLYTKAANQGDVRAQVALGNCFAKGIGVSENWKTAAQWFAMAAEQGDDVGIDKLAICYEKGLGVPKDINKSKEWRAKLSIEYR